MRQRPPSSKQLFSKEGSSPPTHRPPTGRRQLTPIPDSEKRRSPPRSPNGSRSTSPLLQDLRDMVPPASRGGQLPPPIPPPGAKFSRRHQSLPNGVANRELPMRGHHKATNLSNGSPRLSPINSPANSRRNQQQVLDETQPGRGADVLPPAVPPLELAESWPRSRVRARGKGAAAATPGRTGRPAELITADPLSAVGGST